MNVPFFIAKRYLFSKKKRNVINIISLISMFGVGVGAMALVIILSAFNGINNLVKGLYSSFDAELRIEARIGKTFDDTKELRNIILKTPNVYSINRSLEETVLLKYRQNQSFATIKGVDKTFIEQSNMDSLIWAGSADLFTENQRPALITGFVVAEKLGLFIQSAFQPVYVYAAKHTTSGNVTAENAFFIEPITPSGIFAVNQDVDSKYVVAPYEFVAKLLNKDNKVTAYELALDNPNQAGKTKELLQVELGDRFIIKTRYQQNELLYKTNNTEKWATFLILTFILLIATFNIIGSLTILILDKKRDIFVLRGMGALNQTIRHIFFIEGLLISLTGGFVGILLGIVLVILQAQFGFIPVKGLLIDHYPVELRIADVFSIIVLVTVIGSLAALLPSRLVLNRYL